MNNKYCYEDIFLLTLPRSAAREVIKKTYRLFERACPSYGDYDPIDSDSMWSGHMKAIIKGLMAADYMNTVQYSLAENNRERAISAFQNPVTKANQDNVLRVWISVVETVSAVEKAMLGWPSDKI